MFNKNQITLCTQRLALDFKVFLLILYINSNVFTYYIQQFMLYKRLLFFPCVYIQSLDILTQAQIHSVFDAMGDKKMNIHSGWIGEHCSPTTLVFNCVCILIVCRNIGYTYTD